MTRVIVFVVVMVGASLTNCGDPVVVPNKPPNPPSDPSPADGTIAPINTQLRWQCTDPDGDPLSYGVYFGTDSIPPSVAESHTQTSYDPGTLEHDSLYYWRIVAKDDHGNSAVGSVWRFRTASAENQPPNKPWNPSPTHNQFDVPVTTTLRWQSSDPDGDPMVHVVYMDTLSPPTTVAAADTDTTEIDPPGILLYGERYYWQVVVKDSAGLETEGDEWSFRTAENGGPEVTNTWPSQGAADLNPRILKLTWEATDPEGDAITYDVVLDTLGPPVKVVANGLSEMTYTPLGLIYGQEYHWKIIARDSYGNETNGSVWSFTTQAPTRLSRLGGLPVYGTDVTSTPYVATKGEGVGVVEFLPDPYQPAWYTALHAPGDGRGVAEHGSNIYLAAGTFGLHVLEGGVFADSCETLGSAERVAIEGDYAYVADADSGLCIIAVGDPYNISRIRNYRPWSFDDVTDVAVKSGFVYVAIQGTSPTLALVDATDPDNPGLVGDLLTSALLERIAVHVSGDLLCVATTEEGWPPEDSDVYLYVFDVSVPNVPTQIGSRVQVRRYSSMGDVFVENLWVYVAHSNGVTVYDIRDPAHPSLAGLWEDGSGHYGGVAASSQHIYLIGESAGFDWLDRSPLELE